MSTSVANQAILSFTTKDVRNAVESKAMSKKFVEKLIKSSILNIIFKRIDIEKSEFTTHKYREVPYVIFKRKSTNKIIRSYHDAIKAILESLEKDYLKNIFLFMRNDTGDVIETYTFYLKYNREHNVVVKADSKVVDSTFVDFFTVINKLDEHQKLHQQDIRLHFEFKYYPGTPDEYQPPGFQDAANPLCMAFPLLTKITLGSVHTGFHKISCCGSGKIFQHSRPATPAPSDNRHLIETNSQDVMSQTQLADVEGFSQEAEQCTEVVQVNLSEECEPRAKRSKGLDSNISISFNERSCDISETENVLQCPCELNLPQEFELLSCSKCRNKFHLICRGYLEVSDIDKHAIICFYCKEVLVNKDELRIMCILRLIVQVTTKEGKLPIELMKNLSVDTRTTVFDKLKEIGIYDVKGANKTSINKKKWKKALTLLFSHNDSQIFS